jgi:hypothetical protein
MHSEQAQELVKQVRQGKRLLLSEESEDYSWLYAVTARADDRFDLHQMASHRWDVVGPVQHTDRVLEERELIELLLHFDYEAALASLRQRSPT